MKCGNTQPYSTWAKAAVAEFKHAAADAAVTAEPALASTGPSHETLLAAAASG